MRDRLTAIKSAVVVGDSLYCVPGSLNNLYKICLSDWSIQSVCELPFAPCQADVFYEDGSIWCVPIKGVQVFQYIILTGDSRHFILKTESEISNLRENLCAVFLHGIIWIIPKYVPEKLYKFVLNEKKFDVDQSWINALKQKNVSGRFRTFCVDHTNIYIVVQCTKNIFQYNFGTSKANIHDLPVTDTLFCITKCKDIFYITTENTKKLICWNYKENNIKECSINGDDDRNYVRAIAIKGSVLLFKGKNIDIFDGEKIKKLRLDYLESSNLGGSLFLTYIIYKNKFLLLPYNSNKLVVLDEEFNIINYYDLKVAIEEVFIKKELLYEKDYTLEEFLNGIKNCNYDVIKDNIGIKYSIGAKVYDKIVREI